MDVSQDFTNNPRMFVAKMCSRTLQRIEVRELGRYLPSSSLPGAFLSLRIY